MSSDDENLSQGQKDRTGTVPMDLIARLPSKSTASLDDEGLHSVGLCGDCKTLAPVEFASDVVTAAATCDDAAAFDVRNPADSQRCKPIFTDVQTDETQSSQERDEVLFGENKLTGDTLDKGEGHGLRKRRATKGAHADLSVRAESEVKGMSEEDKAHTLCDQSTPIACEQELKTKSAERKCDKQDKLAGKASSLRRGSDTKGFEEGAKDDADPTRRLPEPLDNLFFRQTIRCEPFTSRPADKSLQRVRPDVFENHITGKFAKSYRMDMGHDPKNDGAADTSVFDSRNVEVDVSKEANSSFAKGIGGLGRGLQHPRSSGMVAFAQAAGRGTDFQGWLPASKVTMTKCDKCAREFGSSLNHRRHVRVHRRSLNPEKEDLSKERYKLAAFWDKLTPEEAIGIVHLDHMEIEDLSGQQVVDSLKKMLQHSGSPSLAQGALKAGMSLLDVVQGKPSPLSLSSERLFSILDDATEKMYLYGGTSVSVQRFVFNNDAKSVGLEDRNLVATLGFHVELKLVKAWMADKEAEALRCQQALFNEEEAAEKKKAKLLEKKKLKKKRDKKRKGGALQSTLQDLENESIDDEGHVHGIAEEDDSPLATGSSSSSVASAQDLTHLDYSELDMMDKPALTSTIDEHSNIVIEPALDKGTLRDEVLPLEQDEEEVGAASLRATDMPHKSETPPSQDLRLEYKGPSDPLRPLEKSALDDMDIRQANPSHCRNGRVELQSGTYVRKVEQDRGFADSRRREFERPLGERKSLRNPRVATRDDYADPLQRSGRSFEMRYGISPQTLGKPLRKGVTFSGKSDAGTFDCSRVHQYRLKPTGLNRGAGSGGARLGIWTRKVPTAVEMGNDEKNGIPRGNVVLASAAEIVDFEEGNTCSRKLSGLSDARQDVDTSAGADAALASDIPLKESSTLKVEQIQYGKGLRVPLLEVITDNEAEACDAPSSGALLVGSLSVPLGKFATMATPHRSGPDSSAFRPADSDILSNNAIESSDHRRTLDSSSSLVGMSFASDSYPDLDAQFQDSVHQIGLVPVKTCESRGPFIAHQSPKLKSSCPPSSPEKGDSIRCTATVTGPHERSSVKQGSFQGTIGRPTTCKVWRPVGTVAERHDSSTGLRSSRVKSDSTSAGETTLEDVDMPGRSDNEHENWNKELPKRCSLEDEEEPEDGSENLDRRDDDAEARIGSIETMNATSRPNSVELGERREIGADFIDERVQSLPVSLNAGEPHTLIVAVDDRHVSAIPDDLECFMQARWKAAIKEVSSDDNVYLGLACNAPVEVENDNFFDAVLHQIESNSKHQPGAVFVSTLPAMISSESTCRAKRYGAESHSLTFHDSYQGRFNGPMHVRIIDERGTAGGSLGPCGATQVPVARGELRTEGAFTSPLVTDNKTSRSWAIKGSCGSEAQVNLDLDAGTIDSAHALYGVGKEDKWARNSRVSLCDSRCMPRRRVSTGETSKVL